MIRLKLILAGASASILSLGLALCAKAETMSSTTLGTKIDTVNTTFMDFLGVLIEKYWPFLLGAIILVAVWAFGRKVLSHFI